MKTFINFLTTNLTGFLNAFQKCGGDLQSSYLKLALKAVGFLSKGEVIVNVSKFAYDWSAKPGALEYCRIKENDTITDCNAGLLGDWCQEESVIVFTLGENGVLTANKDFISDASYEIIEEVMYFNYRQRVGLVNYKIEYSGQINREEKTITGTSKWYKNINDAEPYSTSEVVYAKCN